MEEQKPPAPRAPQKAAPPAILMRPLEWAQRLGLRQGADGRVRAAVAKRAGLNAHAPQLEDATHWSHAAADKLFGWSHHAYHFEQGATATPFTLTEGEYRAALVAAAMFPLGKLPVSAIPQSQLERLSRHRPRQENV